MSNVENSLSWSKAFFKVRFSVVDKEEEEMREKQNREEEQ